MQPICAFEKKKVNLRKKLPIRNTMFPSIVEKASSTYTCQSIHRTKKPSLVELHNKT
jgi:hypothetical protein